MGVPRQEYWSRLPFPSVCFNFQSLTNFIIWVWFFFSFSLRGIYFKIIILCIVNYFKIWIFKTFFPWRAQFYLDNTKGLKVENLVRSNIFHGVLSRKWDFKSKGFFTISKFMYLTLLMRCSDALENSLMLIQTDCSCQYLWKHKHI